jgi:curli biogenesis system outer membrane secretion channel CsgG
MIYRGFLSKLIWATILLAWACATSPPKEKELTLAVWDLDNLSPGSVALPNLGELLTAQIIASLKKKGQYTIVERERLLLVLEEQRLGTTSLVDESTRLKLGRLLGARRMVFGGYQVIGEQMRLDLRVLDVESGKILKAVQKTATAADFQGWLEAAKKAAEEL